LTIIAVLAFSAVGTTVAYADGDPTPEVPPAAEETSLPETDPVDTESTPIAIKDVPPPVVETVTPEPPVAEVTPVPTEEVAPPAEDSVTPAPTEEVTHPTEDAGPTLDKPLLDSVPDNTSVTVLNAEGQVQPLVSQAAVEAIQTSDPMWCPAGTPPVPGAGGCTDSFNSFTLLLNFLSTCATCTGDGTIYVQEGAYTGGETTVNFDNYNLSNISSNNLTIQGGWNISSGSTNGTSTLNNVSIIIGSSNPWGGSLTIDNLTITNPAGTGLVLTSQNDITLTDVTVTNSTNGAGAELTTTGGINSNVTIERSKFTRNKTAGAIIRATGSVAISDSWFNSPANARRQNIGLDITSGGSVSLARVLADQNRRHGAKINATGRVTIVDSDFSWTMDRVGSAFFGEGLTIVSSNAIDLDGVTSDHNFLWGASLTSGAGFDVTVANSNFNSNTTSSDIFIDDTGLIIRSGGQVFIDTTHADNNRLFGADIVAADTVTVSNSFFNSNNGITVDGAGNTKLDGIGLKIVTTGGDININNVEALDNTVYGALLNASQNVTVGNNSDFGIVTLNDPINVPIDPNNFGLQIIAGGDVFLDTITLNNNATFGADITAGGNVFLNAVTALGNGTNGVQVETTNCGELFLIGGTYGGNSQYGLTVLGTKLTPSGVQVFNPPNGIGNISQDPGTCSFVAPPPPPVVYKPVDTGAVAPGSGTSQVRTVGYYGAANPLAGGSSKTGNMMSLNSFVSSSMTAGQATHISLFTGRYAYIYSSSGMQIVVFVPNSADQLAMGGS
jgi:hypothetical protein